nr:hypothetical protein [uncultured Pedobacter sp.]
MYNLSPNQENLIAYLLGIMEMPPQFADLLKPHLSKEITYHEDTQVLKADSVAEVAYWPVRGYIRSYTLVQPEEDREYYQQKTIDISLPDKVSFAANSFMNNVEADFNMEIAKSSVMIEFTRDSFIELGQMMPEVNQLALKIVSAGEKDWHKKMEICKNLASDGYKTFLDHFDAEVESFIYKKHIASYIGTSPENLSRIRKAGGFGDDYLRK